jgi:alpha-tubulin suppressor-like RCC1 family protein
VTVELPKGEQVEALTSAWSNSGALMVGGSFYNWGFNAHDELGNNSEQPADVPVRVPGTFSEVSEGGSEANNGQTLAITTTGRIQGWGDDKWGQLCDGKASVRATPVSINVGAVQVSSAGWSSYYIDKSGDVFGCGSNDYGQMGNSNPILTHATVVSGTSANVAAIVGTGTIGS